MPQYASYFRGFEPVPAARAALAYSKSVEGLQTGKIFRLIQSHVPGGPLNSPAGCAKFAEVVMQQFDANMIIVLMGDMNQAPEIIEAALNQAAKDKDMAQPYTYLENPNPTHINTLMEAMVTKVLEVAMSGTPSPVKSPMARALGPFPTGYWEGEENEPLPWLRRM